MTRFGVMKHLRVLERGRPRRRPQVGAGEAALPEPRPDPPDPRPVDRQVHRAPVCALADLKAELEENAA